VSLRLRRVDGIWRLVGIVDGQVAVLIEDRDRARVLAELARLAAEHGVML
jgi:hypothetical protein